MAGCSRSIVSAASVRTECDNSTLKAAQPPKRPGFGSSGEKCLLRANRFLVKASDLDLHHYNDREMETCTHGIFRHRQRGSPRPQPLYSSEPRVIITPETALKKFSRDIIATLVRDYRSKLGNRMLAFDRWKNVYTAGALPFGRSQVFLIKLKDSRGRDLEYNVTLKLVAKVGFEALRHFVDGRSLDCPQEAIQALDIILRSTQSLCRFTRVGRSFFSRELDCGSLGKGIEFWGVYHQSIRPTQMGLSLNGFNWRAYRSDEESLMDGIHDISIREEMWMLLSTLVQQDHDINIGRPQVCFYDGDYVVFFVSYNRIDGRKSPYASTSETIDHIGKAATVSE